MMPGADMGDRVEGACAQFHFFLGLLFFLLLLLLILLAILFRGGLFILVYTFLSFLL
jgi:hypothetical protein